MNELDQIQEPQIILPVCPYCKTTMDVAISSESLSPLGFSSRERNSHGFLHESYVINVFEDEMRDDEKMFIWIERGNGYDPDCWNAIFLRTENSFNPARPMTLRHGLKNISEVKKILAIFQ